jgi:hypothetical protein
MNMPTDEQYDAAIGGMKDFVTHCIEIADLMPLTPVLTFIGPGFSDPTLQPSTVGDPFDFLLPLEGLFNNPEIFPDKSGLYGWYLNTLIAYLNEYPWLKAQLLLLMGYDMPLGPLVIPQLVSDNGGIGGGDET